jgi:hypothetical protein
MEPVSTDESDPTRETLEFSAPPAASSDQALKDTVDDKLVLELLGQLLITASQSHRSYLEKQEIYVSELVQRLPADARFVESELAKVYQDIKASFSRLVEAIGDDPLT